MQPPSGGCASRDLRYCGIYLTFDLRSMPCKLIVRYAVRRESRSAYCHHACLHIMHTLALHKIFCKYVCRIGRLRPPYNRHMR